MRQFLLRSVLLPTLILGFPLGARAGACPEKLPEPLTAEVIRDVLIGDCGAKSVNDVIPRLPMEFRRNLVLMRESRAFRGKECVTPSNPRVIFHSDDGKLVFAFPWRATYGDPRCSFADFVQFRPDNTVDGKLIFFDGKGSPQGGATYVEAPAQCKSCHGPDFKYIWGNYPDWKGAFGGNDDSLQGQPAEEAELRAFIENVRKEGKLSWFGWSEERGRPTGPAYLQGVLSSKGDFAQRPNAVFTLLLARLNAKRVAAKLRASSRYAELKYQLIQHLIRCKGSISSLEWLPWIQEILRGSGGESRVYGYRDRMPADELAATLAGLGHVPGDLSLIKGARTDAYNDGASRSETLLLSELIRSEPELQPYAEMKLIKEESFRENFDRISGSSNEALRRLAGVDSLGGDFQVSKNGFAAFCGAVRRMEDQRVARLRVESQTGPVCTDNHHKTLKPELIAPAFPAQALENIASPAEPRLMPAHQRP